MLPKIDKIFLKNESNQKQRKIFPEYDYKLQFDGCSKNNPGLAGAGAVIYRFGKEIWSDKLFIGENETNNYAEYSGLILGLQKAKELNIKNIKVEGDSQLVINHMKDVYQCKSSNLVDLYEKAKNLESYFESIEYQHIYRNKNKRADELSNLSIENYLRMKAFNES